MEKWEKQLKKQYQKAYKKLESTFYKNSKSLITEDQQMRDLFAKGLISKKEYQSFRMQARTELHKQVNELAKILNKADKAGVDIVNSQLPHAYAESMNRTIYSVEKYNIKTGFDIVSDDAVLKSVKGTYFRKLDMVKNTAYNRRRISSAITAGILRGSSVKDVAKTLLPLVNGNERSALLNARTWINSAENGGSFDAAEKLNEAGIKMKKIWLSAGDERVRDSHRELDGEERDIDEEFSNGGQYPCDPKLAPEEYYNCRCTILNFPEGFEPDLDSRNMDIDESYEDWKAGKK